MTYLNAAGHGLPDPAVRERMIAHLEQENEIGVVASEAGAAAEMARVRAHLADIIGAEEAEIALLPWGTIAWNAPILSMPLRDRRVLVAQGEWGSNVALLQRLGARIEVMPVDSHGRLDVAATGARIDDDLAALFTPLVCSLTGERYPVEAIGRLPRPENCFFVVDAAQAVGQIPVNMNSLGADILAAPARKWLRGPRGTGFVAVRRGALARLGPSLLADTGSLIWQGDAHVDGPDARRFEPMGTFAAQRLGLGVALAIYMEEADATHARIAKMAAHVRARADTAGIAVAGVEEGQSGIVTLRGLSGDVAAWATRAAAAGITVKAPTPDCEPLRHVSTVEGGFLRVSPHVYNTEHDIDALFRAISG